MFQVAKYSFHELLTYRDKYKEQCQIYGGMHRELVERFIKIQTIVFSPICPHICERVWKLTGNTGSVLNASWPDLIPFEVGVSQDSWLAAGTYLAEMVHRMRVKMKALMETKSKKGSATAPAFLGFCEVFIAEKYPPWQAKIVDVMKKCFNKETNLFPSNQVISSLVQNELGENKKSMPFVQRLKEKVIEGGSLSCLESKVIFSEKDILSLANEYICYALDLDKLWVKHVSLAPEKVEF